MLFQEATETPDKTESLDNPVNPDPAVPREAMDHADPKVHPDLLDHP